MRSQSLFTWPIARRALIDAFVKLDPRWLLRNPVMFSVEVVTVLVSGQLIVDIARGTGDVTFELQIAIWLWLTVLFANFAEAIAEGRGRPRPTPSARPGPRPWPASAVPTARATRWRAPPSTSVTSAS